MRQTGGSTPGGRKSESASLTSESSELLAGDGSKAESRGASASQRKARCWEWERDGDISVEERKESDPEEFGKPARGIVIWKAEQIRGDVRRRQLMMRGERGDAVVHDSLGARGHVINAKLGDGV